MLSTSHALAYRQMTSGFSIPKIPKIATQNHNQDYCIDIEKSNMK